MIRSCPQTTLRSLFISAMAVSALLPASEGPIQASPVNANPAFESLRATASSWGASDARAIPAPPATPQSAASTVTPPPITPENLKKLLAFVAIQTKRATIGKPISTLLGLTTGDEEMNLKSVGETIGDITHSFAVSQKPKTDDILIVVRKPGIVYFYLTDSKLTLRAAGYQETGLEPKLILNEKARPEFDKELKYFNDQIAKVPGNA